MYNTYILYSLHKNTAILKYFPMPAILASEATIPMLLVLFQKKLVGENFNRNIGSSNSYSPHCLLHHMGETLVLLHSELELNFSEQLQQQKKVVVLFFVLHSVHFPKLVESTEELTSAKQCSRTEGKCLSSSCHQIPNFGPNPEQTHPTPKFLQQFMLHPLPSLPVTIPIPASQLPCPQL